MPRTSRLPDGLVIRPARATDDAAIVAVIRAAFAGPEFGHQGEAELARMIEADGDALVSLVAERDGRTAGHVVFSRMDAGADGYGAGQAGHGTSSGDPARAQQGMARRLHRPRQRP